MLLNTVVRRGRAIQKLTFSARSVSAKAIAPTFSAQQESSYKGNYKAGMMGSLALFLTIGVCAAEKSPENEPAAVAPKTWRTIARSEVASHNDAEQGYWVTYGNSVYDITRFLANHPGGKDRLLGVAGGDIGDAWNLFQNHKNSSLALKLLEEMKIGELDTADVIKAAEVPHVAEFSAEPIYDVIIVGAGLSGLMCGSELINRYGVAKDKILVLEAQDYVGGRVKQVNDFIKGTKIEVGAEFLHGNNTELTKFARATNQPLREIYCWAHGDGGPLPEPAAGGYGLYYVGATKPATTTGAAPALTSAGDVTNLPYTVPDSEMALNSADRLLRYDATDADFVSLNKALWELCDLHEDDYDETLSLYDYLISKKLNPNMLKMAAAGFANTLCSNSYELSLKQAVKWSRIWHAEGDEDEEDGDYTFGNSYSALVDHLKKDLQIEINTPIASVQFSTVAEAEGSEAEVVEEVEEEESGVVSYISADGKDKSEWVIDERAEGGIRFLKKDSQKLFVDAAVTTASALDKDAHLAHAITEKTEKKEEEAKTQPAEDSIVTITTAAGTVYRARKLVMTPSPHVINTKMIDFNPALPSEVVEAYDCTQMNNITKVIMKFTRPCWPKDLHGMIMVDDDFLLPEVWFRHVPDEVEEGEEATAYAVGFATSKYAERIANMTQAEVLAASVSQLEKIFDQLEQQHMSGEHPEAALPPASLPRASSVYLGGMYWDWQPGHHKYIGGGYCSPRVNKPINSGEILSKAFVQNRLFFAGEATNDRPGATAHAALETGIRAASLVSAALEGQEPVWKGYVFNKSP